MLISCLLLACLMLSVDHELYEKQIEKTRNFYGVTAVFLDKKNTSRECMWLRHGTVAHGAQFTHSHKQKQATAFYGKKSAVGLTMHYFPRRHQRRVGVIGLGVGTIAAYGKAGDNFRFYEINPGIIRIASTHFTFLKDSRATIEVIPGDARLSLEQESQQRFDVLVLDAFNSDSVPVHLLTKEAFEIYINHLKPDGVILVGISTYYLDLEPVIHRIAEHHGFESLCIANDRSSEGIWWANWVVVTRNKYFLNLPVIRLASSKKTTGDIKGRLWTDDYVSIYQAIDLF
ncbi:MAG: hypothetical protein GY941_11700 [Planctomycetes bacterium]|nr:hypothetical protein [Planctomycetota bacterium]